MERSGVINIYKEAGYTSHDVVAKLRGILKQKKDRHTEPWILRHRVSCRSALEKEQN